MTIMPSSRIQVVVRHTSHVGHMKQSFRSRTKRTHSYGNQILELYVTLLNLSKQNFERGSCGVDKTGREIVDGSIRLVVIAIDRKNQGENY